MTPGRDFNPDIVFAVMIVMLAMVLNNSTNVRYDYKGIKLRVGVAGAVAAPNASSAAPSSVHHSPNKHFVPSSSPSSAGAPVRPSAAARPTLPPSTLSPVKGRRSSPLSAAPSPSSTVPSPAPSPQSRKPASPQAQPPSTSSIVPVAQTPAEITQENSAVRKISFVTSSVAIPTACAFLLM
ncbi:hypothetical protein O6H91_23G058300 [Diphasiastrum complanatum]|uniref:Uncharacterized protein n=1 Tax=Diphasiastrum complanatum TaxID=34168 RepID=A0ACC2AB73_DIPCM|nr:hypothetical protein O6H91_23G058300 [Diphasiastrum complanatum]